MRFFRESTIPHFDLTTSLGDGLKTQFIGDRLYFTTRLTRVPGIIIFLAANIAMKYEYKFWAGDGTLIIRVNREAMLYFKTASILSTFNACKRWEVRERLLNPRLCFKRFPCVVSNLQTSKTNNRLITRLRLDKNKLNTCQGKYNNIPYDLRTCPRALPQYHRKYGTFHCYLSSL